MPIIDSHCHLDFQAFDVDRESVLDNCTALGVEHIVIPAVTANTWQRVISLCSNYPKEHKHPKGHKHPMLHFALGLHPIFLAQHKAQDINLLDTQLDKKTAIAVGEIGLDFFIKELDQIKQIEIFEAQLILARKHDLPVILHVRKAHDQTIALLKKYPTKGGIVHAFNGSMQQAHSYIELGFKLGFGGMLTYERSRKLRLLAKSLPLESIVLETDSPDMTVEQHRGYRNSPEFLPLILEALTDIRHEKKDLIAAITTQNVKQLFQLPKHFSVAD